MGKKQTNPNSLANLRKPKPHRMYGYRYQIPQEKIDELYKRLTEGEQLREAAKNTEMCYDTAKKYFEKGDDRRGIRPLKVRLLMFQDSVTKEFNVDLIERRREFLDMVHTAIDQVKEELEKGNIREKASYTTLERLMKLEIYLLGGQVEKRETRKLEVFSAEDIRSAASSG